MSTIVITCTDQVLTVTTAPTIASGGVQEDYVHFDFCELWSGFRKTAVFWQQPGDVHYALLDGTDTCQIPHEAMARGGVLYIGVFGFSSGVTRTSEVVAYIIEEGAVANPPEPSPNIYLQLLAAIAEIEAGEISPERVEGAVLAYLADNPVQEVDPTVPEWAREDEPTEFTNQEVIALWNTIMNT